MAFRLKVAIDVTELNPRTHSVLGGDRLDPEVRTILVRRVQKVETRDGPRWQFQASTSYGTWGLYHSSAPVTRASDELPPAEG